MQKAITPDQLKAVHTLFGKLGITNKDDKKKEILAYTGGRTDSSRAMSFSEAKALIEQLKSLNPEEAKADKMRKRILSMAHEMNWKAAGKADMKRINEWCEKSGYLHKKLDEYKYKELPKLVTQFEAVYKHFIKKV